MLVYVEVSTHKALCRACKKSIPAGSVRGRHYNAYCTRYYHIDKCFFPPFEPIPGFVHFKYHHKEDKHRLYNKTVELHKAWLEFLDRKGPEAWNDILAFCYNASPINYTISTDEKLSDSVFSVEFSRSDYDSDDSDSDDQLHSISKHELRKEGSLPPPRKLRRLTKPRSSASSSNISPSDFAFQGSKINTQDLNQMVTEDAHNHFLALCGHEIPAFILTNNILPFLIGPFKVFCDYHNEVNTRLEQFGTCVDHTTVARHLALLCTVSNTWKSLLESNGIWKSLLITHVLSKQLQHNKDKIENRKQWKWDQKSLDEVIDRIQQFVKGKEEPLPLWKLVYLTVMTETCCLCVRKISGDPFSLCYTRHFLKPLNGFICSYCWEKELSLYTKTDLKKSFGKDGTQLLSQLHEIQEPQGHLKKTVKYALFEIQKLLLPQRAETLETVRKKLLQTVQKKLEKSPTSVDIQEEVETLEELKATPELLSARNGVMLAWSIKDDAVCRKFKTAKQLWKHLLETRQDQK